MQRDLRVAKFLFCLIVNLDGDLASSAQNPCTSSSKSPASLQASRCSEAIAEWERLSGWGRSVRRAS
ncbi:hypothetical protein [Myxacorys almedinensis]|uniref:Uncharacterized protein n=1 Tax=Myxacorys almedinensis A TaxID=2690445 RepID=A0A8J7Z0G5_9CYAN|nr:hypothetical protein [Myxacorys almedinensis]NDJ17857.1 hypothetical protein [Myxacorys almedinensis A]